MSASVIDLVVVCSCPKCFNKLLVDSTSNASNLCSAIKRPLRNNAGSILFRFMLKLQNDLNDIRQSWQRRPKTTNRRWLAAAAVALLVFTSWAAWGYYHDQQPASLYAEYFAISAENEDYLAVRGDNETTVPGLSAALAAYQQQDYQQSLALFQSLREDQPFDGFILRYTALAAMQLGDYYTAEQALEQCLVIDVPSSDRMAAQWYLALVYLRLDRQKEGQSLLQELAAAGNGMYATQAKQLLLELTK